MAIFVLQNLTTAHSVTKSVMMSTLCVFYPANGAPEARQFPTDNKAKAGCFPNCYGIESKSIKTWEFEDSVFRGRKATCWMVWVIIAYNDEPVGAVNEHMPWIKGDAFLSVTVEGHVGADDEFSTFNLDFTALASIEAFSELVAGYKRYREAEARAMSAAAADEADAALTVVEECPWIPDAAAKLGIAPAV